MSGNRLIKLILVLAVSIIAGDLHAGELAIIVNKSGPLTGISMIEVRDIYLGNIRFVEGVKVFPLNHREGPLKEAFLDAVVGMSPKDYRRYWVAKSFQEGIVLPQSKTNFQEIMFSVALNPGAIGYLPLSELEDTSRLKIIATVDVP